MNIHPHDVRCTIIFSAGIDGTTGIMYGIERARRKIARTPSPGPSNPCLLDAASASRREREIGRPR